MERLFIAYFENGEDIGDIRVLADIADLCGMDGAQIADMLESDHRCRAGGARRPARP